MGLGKVKSLADNCPERVLIVTVIDLCQPIMGIRDVQIILWILRVGVLEPHIKYFSI